MTYGSCAETVCHRNIRVREMGRTFRILNSGESDVTIVEVDGCLIKQQKACDYLFDISKNNAIHYVELKGKNTTKAVGQLLATMAFFKKTHEGKSKNFYIVASRVPGTTAQKQKLLREFRSKTGCKLFIRSGSLEISI